MNNLANNLPIFVDGTNFSLSDTFLTAYEALKNTYQRKLKQVKFNKLKQPTFFKNALRNVVDDANELNSFYNDLCDKVRGIRNRAKQPVQEKLTKMFEEFSELIKNYSKLKRHLKRKSAYAK